MPRKPQAQPDAQAQPAKKRGGARPGAGRKPKAVTVIRDQVIREVAGSTPSVLTGPGDDAQVRPEDKAKAADYAFRLFDRIMRGTEAGVDPDPELRIQAAKEILNRAWGKPPQSIALTAEVKQATDLSKLDDEQLANLGTIAQVVKVDNPD